MLNFELRGNYVVLTDTTKDRKEYTGHASEVFISKDDAITPNFYIRGLKNWSEITAIPFSRIDGFASINDFIDWYSDNTGDSTSSLQAEANTSLDSIDDKLTGGSQKSIVRGGAKGTTTSADVTSTNIDSNTQALDVTLKESIPTGSNIIGRVTQNGTWTVQPGNTPNTTPWSVVQYLPIVLTTGDAGAKTVSGNGNTMNNNQAKGLNIVFNIGAVSGSSPMCTFKIQGSSDVGITWFDVPNANTANLTATGVYGIQLYPSITPVSGTTVSGTIACVNAVLPRTWRVVWTISGVSSPSFTITNIQVAYIP